MGPHGISARIATTGPNPITKLLQKSQNRLRYATSARPSVLTTIANNLVLWLFSAAENLVCLDLHLLYGLAKLGDGRRGSVNGYRHLDCQFLRVDPIEEMDRGVVRDRIVAVRRPVN